MIRTTFKLSCILVDVVTAVTNKKWKLNLTSYYFPVRLSNFISHPGGRGALSLLSLISLSDEELKPGSSNFNSWWVSLLDLAAGRLLLASLGGHSRGDQYSAHLRLSLWPWEDDIWDQQHYLRPTITFKTNNIISDQQQHPRPTTTFKTKDNI